MHIPTCQTQDLEILTFQQALVPTNEDYDRTKWLYVPDYYADYRYLLGTRGESLICIGINPSTARGDLDNTLKSVGASPPGTGMTVFDVQRLCPAGHPAGGHGPGVQRGPPPGEHGGLPLRPGTGGGGVCPLPCGRPGEPSLRSAPTSGTASGTWWPSGRRTGPSGCAPASALRRAIPTTPLPAERGESAALCRGAYLDSL